MAGLVYKDLINLGQQWKSYLLILLLWGGISVAQNNPYFFGGMFSVYMVIISLTACGYDEKSGWDRYALTLPVSRARIVLSKYVLGLLMDALGFVTALVFFILNGTHMQEIVFAQCVLQSISLFLLSVQLPVIVKFGVEKARIIVMAVILCPLLLAYLVVQAEIKLPDFTILARFIYFGPVFGLCLLAVSAAVSIQIYKEKEF